MEKQVVTLLELSATEIKALRSQNQIMAARLNMFDDMMSLFNASKNQQGGVYAPDIVYEIEKHITYVKGQAEKDKE